MVIYKITNMINKKVYIGQTTTSIENRWKHHLKDCKREKNNKFYNAIKKYGSENFKIEVIENEIEEQRLLNERERYWIGFYDSYKNGYNSTLGGEESPMHYKEVCVKVSNSKRGKKFTEEHKQHLRLALEGKQGCKHTEEHKRYMSNLLKGRTVTEETRNKLREANLGKKQSKETTLKRSKAMKGKKFTEDHKQKISQSLKGHNHVMIGKENPRSKSVAKIDIITGKIIETFDSACLAEKSIGKPQNTGSIIRVANGQRKTAYGYRWEWV
jgi:group I intron endonuclease